MINQEQLNEGLKLIVFRLNNEEYGVDVGQVRSIERMQSVTRIPGTPAFVKGVINLRGVVIPILDLNTRFALSESEITDHTRIIVVAHDNVEIGLIVDEANDVLDVPQSAIEPPPTVVGKVDTAYLRGVAKLDDRLLILLNLDKVLHPEELQQLHDLER